MVLSSAETPGLGASHPGWRWKVTGSRKGLEWTELLQTLLPLTVSVMGTKPSVPQTRQKSPRPLVRVSRTTAWEDEETVQGR